MKNYLKTPKLFDLISNTRGLRRLAVPYQKEKRISCGTDYPDKTFYIIRWGNGEDIGLMAILNHVISHLIFADRNGYIPVVDMMNYRNPYMSHQQIGKLNAWELFFEQPAGFNLRDVAGATNVILSSIEMYRKELDDEDKTLEITRKYIRFSKEIQDEINHQKDIMGVENKRVCGIKLRGTDYVSTRPSKHAIQPSIEQAISIIDDRLEQWQMKYDRLFLATEDADIYKAMKEHYGNQLACVDIERMNAGDTWHKSDDYKANKFQSGANYCVEIGILAECDALIASICNGTESAIRLNGGRYEGVHLIDLGRYE